MVLVEPFLKADNYKEIQHLLWKPNFYYRIRYATRSYSTLSYPISLKLVLILTSKMRLRFYL